MRPQRGPFDVAVLGGGSAGLAAAVIAAREGARTLLIERHGYLGGMGTASLVHTFCGLYLLGQGPDAVLANPGFASEMAERMIAATGQGPVRTGRVDVLPQHPVEFVRIADELVSAETTLEVLLHCELVGIRRDGAAWELEIATRGGMEQVVAKSLVDASGDAVAAAMVAGSAAIMAAPRLQRPAYVCGISLPVRLDDEMRLHTAGLLVEGVRNGDLPAGAMGISFRASGRRGEVFATIDLTGAEIAGNYNPLDAACLTGLEMEGRKIASTALAWLVFRAECWRGACISQWPLRAGVRESRRWIGEATLTGADLLASRRFDDEIALATWPMEFRESNRGPKLRFPENSQPCGIPIGCLKPAGIDGLFVAGRCISTDHDAQASIRVMGTCFATGEAAGRAAAKSAASG